MGSSTGIVGRILAAWMAVGLLGCGRIAFDRLPVPLGASDASVPTDDDIQVPPNDASPAVDAGVDAASDGELPDSAADLCPDDDNKTVPGICGCGVSDEDTDDDGTADCDDGCPGDPLKVEPGVCGCGVDCNLVDADDDAIADDGDDSGSAGDNPCRDGEREGCDDNCPGVANPWQEDADNDGIGDACDAVICRSSSVLVATGFDDQVYVSLDQGLSWTLEGTGEPTANWEDVAFGRGTWIVGDSREGSERWARSTNGTDWTVLQQDLWPANVSVEAVGYGDGLWLLGSENGDVSVSFDDGLSFQFGSAIQGWTGTVEDFAYAQGRFVMVGDAGQVAYTDDATDPASWRVQTVGTGDLKQVVVGDGMWLTVGTQGTCAYSVNAGEDWADCGLVSSELLYGLHHAAGTWMVAISDGNAVQTSSSGTGGWTTQSTADVFSTGVNQVFGDCGSGRWVAVSHEGTIASSDDDGAGWTLRMSSGTERLWDIAGN